MISSGYLARYAIPFLVAAVYLGEEDILQQILWMERNARLSDEAISTAQGDGVGNEVFDYIVVGAGSAGAVVANRLSASGENRVLLLEAGGDPNPIMDIPWARRFIEGSRGAFMSWNERTVKQEKACGWSDGICPWPHGKALGGTSQINHMIYNKGKAKDYDRWANFTGDPEWSWESVKQVYNGLESYHGNYEKDDTGTDHGHEGPIHIGIVDWAPGADFMEEVFREQGIPVQDSNALDSFTYGFARNDYNMKNGLRVGTYQAFLEPILDRTNLVIYRYATALKVETEKTGDNYVRATGVTYQRHGVVRTAKATKEVILSAGSTETPKLLMLSGIGPRDHLESLNIPVVLDLPVGDFLQDHPSVNIGLWPDGFVVNKTFGSDYNTTDNLNEYVKNGTGQMLKLNFGDPSIHSIMLGYLFSKGNTDPTWPDIHLQLGERYTPATNQEEFFFNIDLSRPGSMGTIRLQSSNPEDIPLIDPNIHGDPEDAEKLVDGIEFMVNLFNSSALLNNVGVKPLPKYEACLDHEEGSREYWKCVVYSGSSTSFHATSSARMGPNSSVAVLNSKLKVFGTSNLRVVDASAMPFVTTGNTNFPSIMIGAKGSEFILADQNSHNPN